MAAKHQTDINGQCLLEDKLKDGKLIQATNTQKAGVALILLSNKVFDDAGVDVPPLEWTNKLPGRALTFSESSHLRQQMPGHIVNPTKGYRFVQWNKSTPKTQAHATTRGACVPKTASHGSKGTSKTTESMNQRPKTSATKSYVIISIIPVGTKTTPPSAGDTKEWEVSSRDPVPRQSSGRGKRKEGTAYRPKTMMGQSGDHRQPAYAFAEAFPPAARTLDIQALGRSEKGWKELEAKVRCYRLKEERLITRLLKLERLQNITIEAERRRTSSANAVNRPKPIGVPGVVDALTRQSSGDQPAADRKGTSIASSARPTSAFSCRDAAHQRKEAPVDAADRKGSADGRTRSNERNTGRALQGSSTRPNWRYAWL